MKLIITVGIAGSGKTTWAKGQVKADETGMTVRVNKDDLRRMAGVKFNKQYEKIINRVQIDVIEQHLDAGYTVIVDNTHLEKKYVNQFRTLAKIYGIEFEVKDFSDVPLDVCLERNFARDHGERVPRDVIVNMHRKLVSA